jgi:hypothetical protein
MPLMTEYQDSIIQSLNEYDFQRILRMKGSCHDALIGELINWWLSQDIDGMICNPARGSKSSSRRYFADLLFLEQFQGFDYYEVKGVAEIENNEEKLTDKIKSLASYENYVKKGSKAYPNLQFAVLCYTLNVPNDELAQKIYDAIVEVSEDSSLLWIVCEIADSLRSEGEPYRIYMPNYVRGYDYFYYTRNFSSVILYTIKKGKQIGDITVPSTKNRSAH